LRFAERGIPPLSYLGRVVAPPPFLLEGRALYEAWRLRRHPVYSGEGLPRGRGQPVLLVPGFMAGDRSLMTLERFLLKLGYHAEKAGLAFNVQTSEAVLTQLTARLNSLQGWLGQRVAIVGHSRGGLLGKVAAQRHPELVNRVIALGSPLADPYDVHPVTMAGVRMAQAFNWLRFRQPGTVERRFLSDLAQPSALPLISIYSRSDGIVSWQACLRADAICVEVEGSHAGLAVNPAVYAFVAQALAGRRLLARPASAGPGAATGERWPGTPPRRPPAADGGGPGPGPDRGRR
jgi:pimeloyl-ACP methyl ester carboxylesterase